MEINEFLVNYFQIVRELETIKLFDNTKKFSMSEFRLMREIVLDMEKGKCIISSELSRRLGITRSAVSQIVTKLEKQNVVQRVPSENDKKIAYIKLSNEAIAVFKEQCAVANRVFEQVVEIVGEEKMRALVASCRELNRVFKDVCAREEKNGK